MHLLNIQLSIRTVKSDDLQFRRYKHHNIDTSKIKMEF